jgi:hypothetical protein
MSKYASLLFPAETFHTIGPFRFPIYKDLVPGEARKIEEIARQQSKSTFSSIKLAQRIAKDHNITTKEAIDLISSPGEDSSDILYDYVDELEELQRYTVSAVDQQVQFVTLFLQYRGEVKLPESDTWAPTADWTAEDTEAMPTKLMEEIFRLILWERDGWPTAEGNDQAPPETPKKS